MREGLVGLGHLVHLVPFADGIPLPLVGVHDFRRERVAQRRALARVGEVHQPAHGQADLAVGGDFQRHLVGGAAHAPGLDLEAWLGVVDRALEDFQRAGLGVLGRDLVEGSAWVVAIDGFETSQRSEPWSKQ